MQRLYLPKTTRFILARVSVAELFSEGVGNFLSQCPFPFFTGGSLTTFGEMEVE